MTALGQRLGRLTDRTGLQWGAVVLSWALSSARIGGEAYAGNLLWHQSVDRLVQVADHAHPLWWYLLMLPVLLLPWSLWLPALWIATPLFLCPDLL